VFFITFLLCFLFLFFLLLLLGCELSVIYKWICPSLVQLLFCFFYFNRYTVLIGFLRTASGMVAYVERRFVMVGLCAICWEFVENKNISLIYVLCLTISTIHGESKASYYQYPIETPPQPPHPLHQPISN
jgi:hypothetical protein